MCAFSVEPLLSSVLLQMNAVDLKDNLDKLNSSMAFLIKHSQKLFRVMILTHTRTHTHTHTQFSRDITAAVCAQAPVYLRDYARLHYSGVRGQQAKVRPQTSPSPL